MNGEEQYSLWPADRAPPAGWSAIGAPSAKDDCLAEIERRWVDLRPRSLREAMATPSTGTGRT